MAAEPRTLASLIEAVADDFSLANDEDLSALSAEDRRLASHLRLVSAIAEVHRSADAPPPLHSSASDATHAGDRTQHWGDLRLLERVGAGAFGEVWRARDRLIDAEVALKLFHRRGAHESVTTRVLQEGRALAKLRHPNVVTVFGVERHGDEVGLRMEFVNGQTLEQLIGSHGPFAPEAAAAIGVDVCRAVAAVHRAGLVHRDIKSQNVMRDAAGRVVLMDLGSGLRHAEAAESPGLAGTPLYLAPEVLNGAPATVHSDIYSVGVLLYHLVTGAYPARAESVEALRQVHNKGTVRSLASAFPGVPAPLALVIDQALAADAEKRPASADELAAGLEQYLRSPGPKRRGRGLLAMALTASIVVALIASLVVSQRSASTATPPMLVAIMPFESSTGRADDAYLASAVTLELTALLGHVSSFNVVPWSVMKDVDRRSLQQVADQTGADMIVEGSVLSSPPQDGRQRVAVRAQVYRAATGGLFWTTTVEGDLGEFFELQENLARRLFEQVRIVLARREQMILERARPVSAQAMELYLKGRLAWESYNGDFEVPIELFRRAITIEPDFAEAYAGLAECYALQHAYSGTQTAQDALARVIENADRAIAIDPSLPDAWSTRAFAKLALAWDWNGAAHDYMQARELSPASPTVAASYANYLITMRRFDEAITVSREALERSPFSPVVSRKLAWAYYVGGRLDEAIAQLKKTLELDARHEPARTLLARAYALKGLRDDGVALMRGAMRPGFEPLLAQVYAASGDSAAAEQLLANVMQPGHPGPLLRYQIAAAYAAMGNEPEAHRWLLEAIAAHDSGMSLLAADPMFDRIRHTTGFTTILKQLRLPQ